jgi:hypothetical protein
VSRRQELLEAEDRGWHELEAMWFPLSPAQVEESGMIAEGWSVKDLLWHLGAWWAEAGMMLERIVVGTYESQDDWGTDEKNARFLEEGRRVDLSTVKAELFSARNRALLDFAGLPEVTHDAEEWFEETGPLHYRGHADDLRRWVEKLTAKR